MSHDLDVQWAEHAQRGLPPDVAKANMDAILRHFVRCNWGGCFLSIFQRLIKPNLEDPVVLREFLCSSSIEERGDLERGAHGEVIFWDLFKYLMNVDSQAIRTYLRETFPGFATRFKVTPFIVD